MTIFKSIHNSNKTYDREFITSLATGLDERWKVTAQKDDDEREIEDYKSYIDYELIEIEQYKTKKFKNDIIKRENMNYNEYKDYYFCAAGKKILLKGTKT